MTQPAASNDPEAMDWRQIQSALIGTSFSSERHTLGGEGWDHLQHVDRHVGGDPESLWHAGTLFQELATRIAQVREQLQARRQELVGSGRWSGQAATAFDYAIKQLDRAMDEAAVPLTSARSYTALLDMAGNALSEAQARIVELNRQGAQWVAEHHTKLKADWEQRRLASPWGAMTVGKYPADPFFIHNGKRIYTPSAYPEVDQRITVQARQIMHDLINTYRVVVSDLHEPSGQPPTRSNTTRPGVPLSRVPEGPALPAPDVPPGVEPLPGSPGTDSPDLAPLPATTAPVIGAPTVPVLPGAGFPGVMALPGSPGAVAPLPGSPGRIGLDGSLAPASSIATVPPPSTAPTPSATPGVPGVPGVPGLPGVPGVPGVPGLPGGPGFTTGMPGVVGAPGVPPGGGSTVDDRTGNATGPGRPVPPGPPLLPPVPEVPGIPGLPTAPPSLPGSTPPGVPPGASAPNGPDGGRLPDPPLLSVPPLPGDSLAGGPLDGLTALPPREMLAGDLPPVTPPSTPPSGTGGELRPGLPPGTGVPGAGAPDGPYGGLPHGVGGFGGMPMMPPMMTPPVRSESSEPEKPKGPPDGRDDDERVTWLMEDRDIWSVSDAVSPRVVAGQQVDTEDETAYVVAPAYQPHTPAPRSTTTTSRYQATSS